MYQIDQGTYQDIPVQFRRKMEPLQLERCTTWELWGTSFSDPGDDHCELRMFDTSHRIINTLRIDGF